MKIKFFAILFFSLIITFLSTLSCKIEKNKKENIFLGIDSLIKVEGRTTYRDYFCIDNVLTKLGYVSVDYKSTKDIDISLFMTENMK